MAESEITQAARLHVNHPRADLTPMNVYIAGYTAGLERAAKECAASAKSVNRNYGVAESVGAAVATCRVRSLIPKGSGNG